MAAAKAALDGEVRALLAQHDFLEVVTTGEGEEQRVRVRCELTRHEMVPRADAISSYLNSRKFQKARDWYCYDYSKYEPYIVAHRRKPKSLFCNVTGTVLNRIPDEVELHVNGKKYKRMKAHVSLSVAKTGGEGGGEAMDDGEFDANAFEFENSQAVWSEEEEEEEEEERAKPRKKQGDAQAEDDEEEEEEEDDLADLYPEDDGSEDERVHEAVQKALQRQSGEGDESMDDDGTEEPTEPTTTKKQQTKEARSSGTKRAAKGKTAKKRRPQTKRQRSDGAQ